ncbi:hypothetical protein CVT26_013904 [Gymnopilus dilepis]|uniref:Elongator complex protein 5 n=1 Tax=Gymnopilus dilepis TaxID=231916 RepID=A0A409VW37_9AGAR|nr:hypothetical protein CVT26_013904 [Gymnopilus dilepis]
MTFFPPFNLPHPILLLVTDHLAAPADFVLHRCVNAQLKELGRVRTNQGQGKGKVVILNVSEAVGRWKGVALKNNVNLQQHSDSGTLEIVDVLAEAQRSSEKDGNGQTLKGVLNHLSSSLDVGEGAAEEDGNTTEEGRKLVILDDVSMLEWIGFGILEVGRFLRALRGVCAKANATLVVRHHIVTPNEPDELFRLLLQLCTYHLEVLPLASGRSGTVSGEVALHPGFSAPRDMVKLVPRSAALQYRLTDTGADFFAKGTSEGVL